MLIRTGELTPISIWLNLKSLSTNPNLKVVITSSIKGQRLRSQSFWWSLEFSGIKDGLHF
jgi:hypothetical protein